MVQVLGMELYLNVNRYDGASGLFFLLPESVSIGSAFTMVYYYFHLFQLLEYLVDHELVDQIL
jgi:hypothetical protein